MRLVIVSDTHGRVLNFRKVCLMQSKADVFIHLGDGICDVDTMRSVNPDLCFVSVKGNVDFGSSEPSDKLLVLEGKRIFLTHGHSYGVKRSYDGVIAAGEKAKVDIILFGHTHNPYLNYTNGIYIMNPGSLEKPPGNNPQFGIIDIIDGSITAFLSSVT